MAILSNGKFYGFLCSVKETGQKLANGAKEYVEDFVSGFVGHGWKIWEYVKGKWMLEIDAIRVRGQFTVFELLVSKIRAIIGAQAITQGCGKIKTVELSEDGTAYLITLEDKDMSFVEHDFIRCQEFIGDKRKYHVEIESVVDGIIRIPITEFTSETDEDGKTVITNPPLPGDDIVQFGNSSYAAAYVGRHSAIYMHADESGQPAIDVLDGIYSKNWSDCLKVRMGGDIPGTDGLKGFYCVNGIIKGIDNDGSILYQFNPDGSGFIGKGSIRWDAAGFRFGTGVKLAWDNLDDETKENLKGESGRDGAPGRDGINGADGVNGADGISLIYKGEFDSHPTSPQQGWYYRNTTDKKCYVFQDNAWYVMTVDGSDGKNGLDGVNGKDGNDGLDIVWKGDSPTPPANPQKNWVYRDTDNGRVYIYNGTAWQLMVADGNDGIDGTDGAPGGDGKDGMSVFITYHDGEEEPAIPTGDGTAEGWHTDATTSVVWMSQKVSESADTGSWGSPIRIKGDIGEPGQDANLLPWVEDWTEKGTNIGKEYIVSPKMFCGTAKTLENGSQVITGVAIGRDVIEIDGSKRTGVFGIKENKTTFELDALTGDATFKGTLHSENGEIGGFSITPVGLENSGNIPALISVKTDSVNRSGDTIRRQATLGNNLPAIVGVDTAAYIAADSKNENIALMLRASGSKTRWNMSGGFSNFAINAKGGCIWTLEPEDHWCMPGVLAYVYIETSYNGGKPLLTTKSWGNGIQIVSAGYRKATAGLAENGNYMAISYECKHDRVMCIAQNMGMDWNGKGKWNLTPCIEGMNNIVSQEENTIIRECVVSFWIHNEGKYIPNKSLYVFIGEPDI